MRKHLFTLAGMAALVMSTHMVANAAPPELRVVGNQVRTTDGRAVRLRGLCIPSLEWSNEGENIKRSVQVGIDDWKANVIRLPLSQDRWFGMAQWQDDGGAAYRKLVGDLVQMCADKNVYMVLDLHWSNAGQWKVWNRQFRMPDWNSVPFWISVAEKYKNHPAVWFDLYNEPHDVSWEVWKDGGTVTEEQDGKTVTFETPGLQKLLRVIRQTGAKNIVVAGGLDWGYSLTGVLKGFALDDQGGNGIVYGTHIYPWKGTQPENWDPHVGEIAKKHPILVGEVGCEPDPKQEDPHVWSPKILKYMDDNGLHYTAWCFHWSASPRLLSDNNYTPTPYWGEYVKKHLADNQPVRALKPVTKPAAKPAAKPQSKPKTPTRPKAKS